MKTINCLLTVLIMLIFSSCNTERQNTSGSMSSNKYTIMTLDPGHFHAALVQKNMYGNVDSVVYVYAPDGKDVELHLDRIRSYNTRNDDPTHWIEKVYLGPDYFERMLKEKPGNIMVVSGNNARKADYIVKTVNLGINVLADKPMIIRPEEFPILQKAFDYAESKDVLLYDIMTERYEITTILQKQLSAIPEIFGQLLTGSPEKPAITKESVHHFFKYVSGSPLIRPSWFFDVDQQGEGLVDVTTHLVDLVQWECFPGQIIDYEEDIEIIDARRWTTDLSAQQFRKVTGLREYPDYLMKDVEDGVLKVYANGEIIYRIKGVYAKVSVIWNFQAPQGTGDTHYSTMSGSRCDLVIRQGEAEGYRPVLYILPREATPDFENTVNNVINGEIQKKYPGISTEKVGDKEWRVNIPEEYKVGHEAHFTQVTEKFLEYLENDNLPEWEVPNMLAKYYITTKALEFARSK